MNKSIVLGLLMAMLVPTAAFADGHVSLGGDVRLRYEYSDNAPARAREELVVVCGCVGFFATARRSELLDAAPICAKNEGV